MTSRWGRGLLGALCLWSLAGSARAQHRTELGLEAVVTSANPVAAVAGGYGALWTGHRVRLVGTAGLGVQDGDLAWRLEGLGHFHLNPASQGLGVYGGAGLALAGGVRTEGLLVILVGLESAPRRPHGWAVELGIGGGVRLSIGYRWRRR